MTLEEIASAALKALAALEVPHMLVGGFSSNAYGIPRATRDVDIVVQMSNPRCIDAVAAHLGPPFELDTQATFEMLTGNVRHILAVKKLPFVVEFFELGDDAFQQDRFARRQSIHIPTLGLAVPLPTAEDVVVQKLRWGRPKDVEDARDVLAVQRHEVDTAYIRKWCHAHGTISLFETLWAATAEA
jgi:hypothetical protein